MKQYADKDKEEIKEYQIDDLVLFSIRDLKY